MIFCWLAFVFMNASEKKSEMRIHGDLGRNLHAHPLANTTDGLTVGEGALIRKFFELLATWEHEERRNECGNKSESRPS